MLIFNSFFVVVKMTERRKNQSFILLFIYFITANKYRFCISVIGYINIQIIGIGNKKSISVDHYFKCNRIKSQSDLITPRPSPSSSCWGRCCPSVRFLFCIQTGHTHFTICSFTQFTKSLLCSDRICIRCRGVKQCSFLSYLCSCISLCVPSPQLNRYLLTKDALLITRQHLFHKHTLYAA